MKRLTVVHVVGMLAGVVLLAAVVRADTIGPCPMENPCAGCSDSVTVQDAKGNLTSTISIEMTSGGASAQTIKAVLNGRSTCVDCDGPSCTTSVKPCGGKTWGEVEDCDDICIECGECP